MTESFKATLLTVHVRVFPVPAQVKFAADNGAAVSDTGALVITTRM